MARHTWTHIRRTRGTRPLDCVIGRSMLGSRAVLRTDLPATRCPPGDPIAEHAPTSTPQDAGTVALLAPRYPVGSETFVFREVQALRALGWNVEVGALRASAERIPEAGSADFEVYGHGWVYDSLAELCRAPAASMRTLLTAVADALGPEESLAPRERVKLLLQAFAALGLAARLRTLGVEVIHCHFAHAPTTLGMYAATQLGLPFGFVGHANDLFHRRALLRKKLERAEYVSCISHFHRGFYQQIAPHAGEKCQVVRCGVDLERWLPVDANAPGREGRPFSVVSVARLVSKKGLDTLIAAVLELPQDMAWRLDIAGDGPLAADLKRQAGAALGTRIHFHGALSNTQVQRLLEKADVFALPCRIDAQGDRDGLPVVLMEAMALGLAVIAGDLPAIRELIEPGVSGVLLQDGRPEGLTSELLRLAAGGEERARLGRAARRRIEQEFELHHNTRRLHHVLQAARRSRPSLASATSAARAR